MYLWVIDHLKVEKFLMQQKKSIGIGNEMKTGLKCESWIGRAFICVGPITLIERHIC